MLERDRCGSGASAGNAGWVTPSLSIPIPGPGVIGQSLRWLIDSSGPLWIRPTLSPVMSAWSARFIANCWRRPYARSLRALQAAATPAGAAFDRLAERGGSVRASTRAAVVSSLSSRLSLEQLVRLAAESVRRPARRRSNRSPRASCWNLNPALGERVLGGLIAHEERRVAPEDLFRLWRGKVSAIERGHEQAAATVCPRRPLVAGRNGRGGAYRGDVVVVASGVCHGRAAVAARRTVAHRRRQGLQPYRTSGAMRAAAPADVPRAAQGGDQRVDAGTRVSGR